MEIGEEGESFREAIGEKCVYVVETRDLLLSLMDSVSFSVYPLLKLPDLLKLPERTYGNTKLQNDPSK